MAARRNAARWLRTMLAAAWRTWTDRPPPSDALQRAAGAWAGRAVAPAWRKLAACGEARRRLRTALVSWAQRELASAWRAWDEMVAARAAATAMARRALYAWSGNELLGATRIIVIGEIKKGDVITTTRQFHADCAPDASSSARHQRHAQRRPGAFNPCGLLGRIQQHQTAFFRSP